MANSEEIFDNIDAYSEQIAAIAEQTKNRISAKILKQAGTKNRRTLLAELTLYVRTQSGKMRSVVEKAFKATIKQINGFVSTEYELKLATEQIKAMNETTLAVLDNITANDLKLQADLRSMLLKNITQKMTTAQVVSGLQTLYPGYASNIGTIVNTSLQRMYRDSDWSVQSDLYDYYKYVGPLDQVTREYCREHVGKVYTKEEAATIFNEIQTFYNCRHKLVGISKSEYEKDA